MYLMICTRSDLAHCASLMSRYMRRLSKMHLEVVNWVFMYIKGSKIEDIFFDGLGGDVHVGRYMDSNYT